MKYCWLNNAWFRFPEKNKVFPNNNYSSRYWQALQNCCENTRSGNAVSAQYCIFQLLCFLISVLRLHCSSAIWHLCLYFQTCLFKAFKISVFWLTENIYIVLIFQCWNLAESSWNFLLDLVQPPSYSRFELFFQSLLYYGSEFFLARKCFKYFSNLKG